MNQFCECESDGFCTRYQREMGGRMRELCRGVNVDLGTAAAFREQWAREAGATTKPPEEKPKFIHLKQNQAVGDAVAMTAAIYSLHRAHPGKYVTSVESKFAEVFYHNPDVSERQPGAADLEMHYPAIHQSNERGIHFMQGWCEFLGMALGISVPLLTNKPKLYFDESAQVRDFWLICSGGKTDFTNKLWGHHNYQQVVDQLKGVVNLIQVGSLEDDHKLLDGVLDARGTNLRELFDYTRQARGVVCGVSLLMHVAAALDKPAIVVAGGREPVQWNAYPKQHYLHTVGALPCKTAKGFQGGACWRSRVVPLGDGTALDNDTCERPLSSGLMPALPQCMTMIKPEEVVALVERYNRSHATELCRAPAGRS